MPSKYYAVRAGRTPGIYRSWEECQREVTGFKGADFKSFKTEKEARDFLNQSGRLAGDLQETAFEVNAERKSNSLVAYVDGSYLSGKMFGSGVVLLFDGEVIEEMASSFEDEEMALMRNVAGEIKASELAITYAIENFYDEISIFYDYEGIAKWPLGEWKANKEGTKRYRSFYEEAAKKIKINFIKVKGHSGNRYNDLADKLAKKAIGLS